MTKPRQVADPLGATSHSLGSPESPHSLGPLGPLPEVHPIIVELFARLDQLIGLLADDATLRSGLLRERARLHYHIESADLLPSTEGLAGVPPLQTPLRPPLRAPSGPPLARAPRERLLRIPCRRLRLACYLALAAGFVDARRFDSLMLLGARAARHRPASHRAAQPASTSSASGSGVARWSSGPRSGDLSIGAAAGTAVGAAPGTPGPPSRRQRTISSTRSVWA